jgi:hypothetical protein
MLDVQKYEYRSGDQEKRKPSMPPQLVREWNISRRRAIFYGKHNVANLRKPRAFNSDRPRISPQTISRGLATFGFFEVHLLSGRIGLLASD